MKANMVAASYHPLVVCSKMTKAYDLNVSTISSLTATEIYWELCVKTKLYKVITNSLFLLVPNASLRVRPLCGREQSSSLILYIFSMEMYVWIL